MALQHINSQVQTTATLIADLPVSMGSNIAVQIYNNHSSAIYIGNETITTSGATIGRPMSATSSFQLWLNGGDKIYAISAAQTAAGACIVTFSA
jgi:hypothetical protein